MSELDWFYINLWKREDEKQESIRVARGTRASPATSSFTIHADVTIVSVNDEEDDFGEEEE